MIFMKKALLWAVIISLALILVSCAVPNQELPTTETTTHETTGYCNGDCTTEWFTTPQPTKYETTGYNCTTQNTDSTCDTGSCISPVIFSAPEDEEKTSVTYHISTENNPTMKVTLYGYKSDMLGESLYFKNNETIEIKVEIKNETSAPIYQWQPTMCHGMTPSHEHEIGIFFADENGNKLTNAHLDYLYYIACPEAIEIWSLAPGESFEWNLSYFAGTVKESVVWKDPICDTEFSVKLLPYGAEIYRDGTNVFDGIIDFAFTNSANDDGYGNTEYLSLPLSLKVFYVGE
jgi:hypothetical protein